MAELNTDLSFLTGDPIGTALAQHTFANNLEIPKQLLGIPERIDVADTEFLAAVARSENEPVYEQYLNDPETGVTPFDATGDAKGRSEIGFGYTFKTGDDSGIKTAGDAFENLRERYTKLIDKIARNSTRFSNIKEMPAKYQRVLLSIADNVGQTRLDDFKELQEAMKQHDVEEIYNQMVTKAKLGTNKPGEKIEYTPLVSRRDNIFKASGF